jgi:hypothetical protein
VVQGAMVGVIGTPSVCVSPVASNIDALVPALEQFGATFSSKMFTSSAVRPATPRQSDICRWRLFWCWLCGHSVPQLEWASRVNPAEACVMNDRSPC